RERLQCVRERPRDARADASRRLREAALATDEGHELAERRLRPVGDVVGLASSDRGVCREEHRPNEIVDVDDVEELAPVAYEDEASRLERVEEAWEELPVARPVDEAGTH